MESWKTSIEALTVDVFGTVTDWYSTIVREGERLGCDKGSAVDWSRFARAWRRGYEPAMGRVRNGELPWTRVDELHRMILDGHSAGFPGPRAVRGRKELFQPRLAQTGSVARRGRRFAAVEVRPTLLQRCPTATCPC